MAVHDGDDAVDDVGPAALATIATARPRRRPETRIRTPARLMCNAVSRSRLPSGCVWRASLKPIDAQRAD
jgi:hypothetical protein